MEISQEDFEKVIEFVYKRGAARPSSYFVSDEEIKHTIADVYAFLKNDITELETKDEPK
ncbi:MAG: hypothetical protein U9O65_02125 [Thermotogota bacterium]|nr:hypothetical protein [Thermotogota bacterium]